MEHLNDNYNKYCIFSFKQHNLTNTPSSNAVLIGKYPQKMRHILEERLLEQVIFYIFSFIV